MLQVQYEPRHARSIEALIREAPRLNREGAKAVAQAVREANRIERLAGRDADGRELTPVKFRVGRYEGATGEPLNPFGEASRSIRSFVVNTVANPDGFTVTAGYQGDFARILRYHADGKAGRGFPIRRDGRIVAFRGIKGATTGIRRDVFGLGPKAREGVREVLRAQAGKLRLLLRAARVRAASYFS